MSSSLPNSHSINKFFIFNSRHLLIITLANWSRRLNDLDKHPGFVLIIFVPIVQLIFLIYLMLSPGKKYNKSLNK